MADELVRVGEDITVKYKDLGSGYHAQVVTIEGTDINVETAPSQGSLTDRSGTITTGGAAQQVAAANTSRKYLFFYNVSDVTMWINLGVAAVGSQPSLEIPSGSSFTMDSGFVSVESVSVFCATTGKAFVAKEA